jgi:hypothetical protein
MVAAQLESWDHVLFFLDHGVSADHTAPDGTSLRKIIEAKRREGASDSALQNVVARLRR